MADPANAYELAHAILAAIVAQFAADGVDLPARQFVTGDAIADDCPQLAVGFERIYFGIPGAAEAPSPITHGIHRVAQYQARITRCVKAVPMSEGQNVNAAAPSVTALETDALVIMTDAYTLHRGLVRAHFDGSSLRGLCEAVSLGPVESFVSGGVGGVFMLIVAELS